MSALPRDLQVVVAELGPDVPVDAQRLNALAGSAGSVHVETDATRSVGALVAQVLAKKYVAHRR